MALVEGGGGVLTREGRTDLPSENRNDSGRCKILASAAGECLALCNDRRRAVVNSVVNFQNLCSTAQLALNPSNK